MRIRNAHRSGSRVRFVTAVMTALVTLTAGMSASRQDPADQVPAAQAPADIAPSALAQIDALLQEKASRTVAQQKVDSQLIYATRMALGQPMAAGVQALETGLAFTSARATDEPRIEVDVTAEVTAGLLQQFRSLGAQIVDATPGLRSARLSVTAGQIEPIASLEGVVFVQPKQEAMTSGQQIIPSTRVQDPQKEPAATRFDPAALASFVAKVLSEPDKETNFTAGQGTVASQGDLTHRAFHARGVFHTNGAGIKIGVLSDGVRSLAAAQALGDLGPVTVIGNPAPCPATSTCDEGTAMLEIVHDLAPGAELFFASGLVSITDFAQKIRDLQAAGCAVIVDDIGYFVETPFQDGQAPAVISTTNGGVVVQAVKDVAALGVLYFSSAANSGNLNDGTSGTWEGDFVDGGAAAAPIPIAGRLHNFTAGQAFNVLTVASTTAPITLHWSDPLGASANDYDLFRLNSTGTTLLAASTNLQNGTQDPFEQLTATGAAAGQRIVVVKSNAAAARFLHVSTNRGRLSVATSGETHGHAATTATGSFGVAATDASTVSPNPFTGASVVESFSSDGPRRIFFNQAGTAFTPGNVSSTGGLVLQKPDFTAADGVAVTGVGGFASPFFGTSAAAPHAAAIGALIKAANPALTASQVRTALTSTAIDIEAAGVDRDAGAGIIMAFQALQAAGVPGTAFLADTTVTATEAPGNGNGAINVGEGAQLSVTLSNVGLVNAAGVTATLTTNTPGVSVTLPGTSSYPDIAVGATGVNATPFRFTVASDASCPLTVNFTLTINHTGGGPSVLTIPVRTGPQTTITTTLDATGPASLIGVTTATGVQVGRMTRNGVTATCVSPKAFPGIQTLVGNRRFDSYAFNTCAENTGGCATVSMSGTGALNMFSAAYTPAYSSTDPSVGHIADPGFSSDAATPYSFSVPAGAGRGAAIAVHEVDPGGAVGTTYTLSVTGLCAGACATPNHVPVARAANVTVPVGAGGTANASINNGSSDADGDALTITQSPAGPYGLGSTAVLLTVVDPKGATSQATGVVTVVTLPTMTLAPAAINIGVVNNSKGTLLSQTPPQQMRLTQAGAGTVRWTASADQPWVTLNGSTTPITGTGPATISVSVTNPAFTLPPAGPQSATVTVNTGGTAGNNPTAAVQLTVIPNGAQGSPTGTLDTPADGATGVTGSIAVTGWAVDDVGVGAIRIVRDPLPGEGTSQVFIGNAVFVAGARPDIAAAFPAMPLKDQAGWGLLLLTNFLPNQGNGTFRLFAYADDVDGHSVLLGVKTITCTNATATRPFGAIDTPGQGEVTSGALTNFGWALTPQPKMIPVDGSTIQVLIDGVPVGTVTYNNPRADIQALFPGYANTDGAIGFRPLDTTTLANGVHTIAWIVADNAGAAEGIGSRFFTVSNSAGSSSIVAAQVEPGVVDARPHIVARSDSIAALSMSDGPIAVTRGLARDAAAAKIVPDAEGVRHVKAAQLEVLRIDLAGQDDAGANYAGYERDGESLTSLPVGSTLNATTGLFSWQPGLAFGGERELVFTKTVNGLATQIVVRVNVEAHASADEARMNIDTPRWNDTVGSVFTIAGWAFDGHASAGAGIDTLHVWAYPVGGGDPIWVGVAAHNGRRRDVGAAFGARFNDSGFTISAAGLRPGTYDIVVYAHSRATGTFNQAQMVRVTVK